MGRTRWRLRLTGTLIGSVVLVGSVGVIAGSAQTPSVELPEPITDVVPVPSVPALPAPAPTVPALPAPPVEPDLPAVPGAPAIPSAPAAPVGSDRAPSGPAPAGPALSGSGVGAGVAAATPGDASRDRPAGRRGPISARSEPRPGRVRRRLVERERRLRALVKAGRGCLARLPVRQRRVLELRAGVGPRDPRSRRSVARALDRTSRWVARAERTALRRLDGWVASSSCGAAAAEPTTTPAILAATLHRTRSTRFESPAPRAEAPRERRRQAEIQDPDPGVEAGGSPGRGSVLGVAVRDQSGGYFLLLLASALLLIFGAVAVTGVRRGWRGFG